MVFTSIPLYLDPPLPNWHQETPSLGDANDPQLQQQLPIQTPPATTSIRPGSMADRARLAKIPQPEAALKCPRCDSTNTKFCYFNNYSLSQPRHLCKTCRRYWTRGGALRNVPVGGGSRRNKRTKGSSSTKSPATTSLRERSSTILHEGPAGPALQPQQELRLPFMADGLHHLNDQYAAIHHDNVGLGYDGIQASDGGTHNMEHHIGSDTNTGSLESAEHWRYTSKTRQVPFVGGLDPSSTIYPFNGGAAANSDQLLGGERPLLSTGFLSQIAPVKMEENNSGMVMTNRNFLGIPGQDQYWGNICSNAWNTTDLTGFPSSSTTHML